jgi:glyoxylase-like metal-dependent hydrolase (beta-lactamase superfamily II)
MTQIAPGVYSLEQSKGGHVHAFLLDDGEDLTLIDTLFDTDAGRVLDRISALGKSVGDLKNIVLTHAHRSHLGGLATLKDLSGATVYSHAWEADIIAGERVAQPISPIPMRPLRTYWRVYYLQFGAALGRGKHLPCPVDETLEDGDTVGPVRVLHAPGHTPGHLAFWWPDRKVLIAGDAIATYPVFAPGWPIFTLNPTQHQASLHHMAELAPEVLAVGHGDPITAGAAVRLRSLVEGL